MYDKWFLGNGSFLWSGKLHAFLSLLHPSCWYGFACMNLGYIGGAGSLGQFLNKEVSVIMWDLDTLLFIKCKCM